MSPKAARATYATYATFVERATADHDVVGLVLKGSQTHEGMPTQHSDYDLYVILADDATTDLLHLAGFRSADLDLAVLPLSDFQTIGMPGTPDHWERYAFVHAQVVLDRLDGLITTLVARKARLSESESRQTVDGHLDAYVNCLYRSLKNHRDGFADAAHLDAIDSISCVLTVIFGLDRRVRPYNKYLRWELERQPLTNALWQADRILPLLRRIAADGDANSQRELFADVEQAVRKAGHGAVLDAWGDDLDLLSARR